MGAPQGFNRKEFLHRIGTFFLLVGIVLIAFFVLSEAAQKVDFEYFCWGTLLLILGFFFRAQYRRAVAPSGRFGWFKRFVPKSKLEDKGKKK